MSSQCQTCERLDALESRIKALEKKLAKVFLGDGQKSHRETDKTIAKVSKKQSNERDVMWHPISDQTATRDVVLYHTRGSGGMSGEEEETYFSTMGEARAFVANYIIENLYEVFWYECEMVAVFKGMKHDMLANAELFADGRSWKDFDDDEYDELLSGNLFFLSDWSENWESDSKCTLTDLVYGSLNESTLETFTKLEIRTNFAQKRPIRQASANFD